MITWSYVPEGGRWLVVRSTPEGVHTIECDCPSRKSAHDVARLLILKAENDRRDLVKTIEKEAERDVHRWRWTGQGKLF